MKHSKTLATAQPTFLADGSINFTAPRSWRELSQAQLRYVLFLLTTFADSIVVKSFMFFRFTGIKVIKKDRFGWMCQADGRLFTISVEQVESLLRQFDYIDSYKDMGVRLDVIDGHRAVNILLHGVRFIDYLNAEKLYQLYHRTQDYQFVERLACVLYRDNDNHQPTKLRMSKAETFGTLLWFAWVKDQLATAFTHFFKPLNASDDDEELDIVSSINIQIRALTDGDVTKEQQIYDIDCWRALTELNFKAKEAERVKSSPSQPPQ